MVSIVNCNRNLISATVLNHKLKTPFLVLLTAVSNNTSRREGQISKIVPYTLYCKYTFPCVCVCNTPYKCTKRFLQKGTDGNTCSMLSHGKIDFDLAFGSQDIIQRKRLVFLCFCSSASVYQHQCIFICYAGCLLSLRLLISSLHIICHGDCATAAQN